MKRLLFIGLLVLGASLKAEGLADTWKELSKYPLMSAVKAVGSGYLIYHSALASKQHAEDSYRAANLYECSSEAIPAAGLAYVTLGILWYWLRPQVNHALSLH